MTLYIVATPIGNLADATARAKEVLARVAVVACEDTRRTSHLLSSWGMSTPMCSYHDHNEKQRAPELLRRLQSGEDVALVCDAGTPLISDPGFELVRRTREVGIEVVPIPGPSALTAALSVCGLPVDRFCFEGFIPSGAGRVRRLATLATSAHTCVLYEAPHRIERTLNDLLGVCEPTRPACIARELTKQFEQVETSTLGKLLAAVRNDSIPARGEFVLILSAGSQRKAGDLAVEDLLRALLDELPPAQSSRIAAKVTGQPRRELYALAETLKA